MVERVEQLNEGQFFGSNTTIAHVAHTRFVISEYESGLTIPRHTHEIAHFCLVLNGSYIETLGKKERTHDPATLVFLPSKTAHAEHHIVRGRHLLIEPDSTWTHRLTDFARPANTQRTFVSGRAVELAQSVYRESQCIDAVSPLVIEGLILELFAEAWRPQQSRLVGSAPRWLNDIRELIESNFRQRIALSELSRVVGIHPGHISRTFRRYFGCCIGDYQRRLRLGYALRRIVNSYDTLADIASEAGFADQSHLSRQVKRYAGQSPQTLRSSSQHDCSNMNRRSNPLT